MRERRPTGRPKGGKPGAKLPSLRHGLDPASGYPRQNDLLKSEMGKVVSRVMSEIQRDTKAAKALRAVDAYLRSAES